MLNYELPWNITDELLICIVNKINELPKPVYISLKYYINCHGSNIEWAYSKII